MDEPRSPAQFDREVMAMMLATNVDLVAEVLRAEEQTPGQVMRAIAATRSLDMVVEDTLHALVEQARGAYLLIRAAIGSATGALAITEAVPAAWLLIVGIARRRLDPVAVVSTVTVAPALAAFALTGGDPLALKLRRGAVTGTLGIAALASVALGRPLLLMVAEHIAKLNRERQPEIQASLAEPERRRAVTILTAIIGLTFAIDGASQTALALTVPDVRSSPTQPRCGSSSSARA